MKRLKMPFTLLILILIMVAIFIGSCEPGIEPSEPAVQPTQPVPSEAPGAATRVKAKWSGGDIYYTQNDGTTITKWDGTNGDFEVTTLTASTGRAATYIVASSEAPDHVKSQADYVCDGTDDQTEINAAIVTADGGTVILSEGSFYISRSANVTRSGSSYALGVRLLKTKSTLEGQGLATRLIPAHASVNIVDVSANYCMVKDLWVYGSAGVQTSAGRGIWVYNSRYCGVSNVAVWYTRGNGLQCSGTAWFTGNNLQVRGTYDHAIRSNGGEDYFVNCIAGAVSDNTTYDAWLLGGTNQHFVNCFADLSRYGFQFYGAKYFTLSDSTIELCARHGVYLASTTTGGIFHDNHIRDCGKETDNTYSGYYVAGTSSGNDFHHNKIWNDTDHDATYGTNRMKYAAYITSGTANNTIEDNDFTFSPDGAAFSTGYISDSGTGTVIARNTGYLTENKGTGQIEIGDSADRITHGLSYMPSVQDILITPTCDVVSTGVKDIWVTDNATSTYFWVSGNTTATTAATFGWQVRK